ncbi:LAMI_0B03972g1_1 [Lachancea mirantina]|uniref:LAMI_0B03972g1_1 n=1 Tax=Lachancea mirantina TaxID=1230905 RepID=A0A1G4IV70_9SACH|nr:LAMI_0B03972g1_1 [Lachancea mirantina]
MALSNDRFDEAESFLASLQSEGGSSYDRKEDMSYDWFTGGSASENERRGSDSGNGMGFDTMAMGLTPESYSSGPTQGYQGGSGFGNGDSQSFHPYDTQSKAQSSSTGSTFAEKYNYSGENGTPLNSVPQQSRSVSNGGSSQSDQVAVKAELSPHMKLSPEEIKGIIENEDLLGSEGPDGFYVTEDGKIGKPRRERTSHNLIEKRYRTNINDKIQQLRDIVPSVRVASKRELGLDISEEDRKDLDGLEPARKLNKATILMKTVEYIRHLENKCFYFKLENHKLKSAQGLSTPESVRNPSTGSSDIINSGTHPEQTSPYAEAYPVGRQNSYGRSDMAGKVLMGGLAVTMGVSSFNEGNDFSTVKGLMALPVFHYSPMEGFSLSNSNGIIDLRAALFSILRIALVVATAFHLFNVLIRKGSRKKKQSRDHIVVEFSDTVSFCTPELLWETVKKTLVINRLKYPSNSIERIESEIACCFALKLISLPFPIALLAKRHVSATWNKIQNQVRLANAKSGDKLKASTDWMVISHVLSKPQANSLDSQVLSEQLLSRKAVYTLKEFVSAVRDFLMQSDTESLISSLFRECSNLEKPIKDILGKIYDTEVVQKKRYSFSQDGFITARCLFEPTDQNIDDLLQAVKITTLSKTTNKKFRNDQVLILYSSIIRNLLIKNQQEQSRQWIRRLPIDMLTEEQCSILGIAAAYLSLRAIEESKLSSNYQDVCSRLELLASQLRIWLGRHPCGNVSLEDRGKLVDHCVNVAVECGANNGDSSHFFEDEHSLVSTDGIES